MQLLGKVTSDVKAIKICKTCKHTLSAFYIVSYLFCLKFSSLRPFIVMVFFGLFEMR
jgi:hypothetical protein